MPHLIVARPPLSSFPSISVQRLTPLTIVCLCQGLAYSKRVPCTNCALRIKKCAPRISSGIYFFKHKLIRPNK